jgi:hypothetical protein
MIQTTKPRARPIAVFRLGARGMVQNAPVWMVRFPGSNRRFLNPALEAALGMAFDWRVQCAVLPKGEVTA